MASSLIPLNAKLTAFTVLELLGEKNRQKGANLPPPLDYG